VYQEAEVRVLVTNDDGVTAPGLHVLAAYLEKTGHDVVVAAPDRDMSGTSASLGVLHTGATIDVREVEVPGCGVESWAVSGPPGLCVVAARLGAFGAPPDVVVSGINAGLNTGRAILHSGTVGAALTAQNFGGRGLAVSVQSGEVWHWETAASFAVEVLDTVIHAPARSVLNLNVPSLPRDEVKGLHWARLAAFGAVRAAIAEASGSGSLQIELRATDEKLPPDTDTALCEAGYAALTAIVGIAEAWPAEQGVADTVGNVGSLAVPGAPFDPVHTIPDHADSRTLRSRDRA
jgi:5'-nucleotidase